jgi:hypothetical protein
VPEQSTDNRCRFLGYPLLAANDMHVSNDQNLWTSSAGLREGAHLPEDGVKVHVGEHGRIFPNQRVNAGS